MYETSRDYLDSFLQSKPDIEPCSLLKILDKDFRTSPFLAVIIDEREEHAYTKTQKALANFADVLLDYRFVYEDDRCCFGATMPVTTFTQMPDYSTVVSQPASDAILEDMNGDSLPDLIFTTVGNSSPSVTLPSFYLAFGNGMEPSVQQMTVATVSDQPYFIVNNMHALNLNGDAYRIWF